MKPVYRVMLISLLCLLLTLLSLGVGEISLSPAETCHYLYLALTSPEGSGMVEQDVLQFIRLPHLVLSFFIGAGLAVCGAVMQAVMKNPLADPYLLGISSGASLGAVLAIALGIGMIGSFDGIGAAAFLGAGLVSLLILLISSISGKGEGLTLLLAGLCAQCSLFGCCELLRHRGGGYVEDAVYPVLDDGEYPRRLLDGDRHFGDSGDGWMFLFLLPKAHPRPDAHGG